MHSMKIKKKQQGLWNIFAMAKGASMAKGGANSRGRMSEILDYFGKKKKMKL